MYFVSIFNNWDTVFPAWHLPWNFVTAVKVYHCRVWFFRRQRLVCGFVIGLHVLPTSEASAFTAAFFFLGSLVRMTSFSSLLFQRTVLNQMLCLVLISTVLKNQNIVLLVFLFLDSVLTSLCFATFFLPFYRIPFWSAILLFFLILLLDLNFFFLCRVFSIFSHPLHRCFFRHGWVTGRCRNCRQKYCA